MVKEDTHLLLANTNINKLLGMMVLKGLWVGDIIQKNLLKPLGLETMKAMRTYQSKEI